MAGERSNVRPCEQYPRPADPIGSAVDRLSGDRIRTALVDDSRIHLAPRDAVGLATIGGNMEQLARFSRLMTFDKRGMGLSDRNLGAGALEDRMDDIRVVLDACDVERTAILGISEGGPLADVFRAATYPERVTHLMVYGSYTEGSGTERSHRPVVRVDQRRMGHRDDGGPVHQRVRRACSRSGRPLRAVLGDPDQRRPRRCASTPTSTSARCSAQYQSTDTGACTTNTIRRSNVQELAAELAGGIRGCPRPWSCPATSTAVGTPLATTSLVGHIERFVTGRTAQPAGRPCRSGAGHRAVQRHRRLRTAWPTRLGDRQLAERARRPRSHRSADELERHRGREVNTTGDGLITTFDRAPVGRSAAGQAIVDAARRALDLKAQRRSPRRAERRDDDLAGVAVHIAVRVVAMAQPDEVLVTRTVKDLVAGSGLEFSRVGNTLKGVPGEWELLAAR